MTLSLFLMKGRAKEQPSRGAGTVSIMSSQSAVPTNCSDIL